MVIVLPEIRRKAKVRYCAGAIPLSAPAYPHFKSSEGFFLVKILILFSDV